MNFGNYSSDEEIIKHDGTILSKIGIENEEIKAKVLFDITIEIVSGISYTGTVSLEIPNGNIISEGKSNYEKTDFSDVIFKRN